MPPRSKTRAVREFLIMVFAAIVVGLLAKDADIAAVFALFIVVLASLRLMWNLHRIHEKSPSGARV